MEQTVKVVLTDDKENNRPITQGGTEAQTPKRSMASENGDAVLTGPKKHMTARKIASLIRNPSAVKPKIPLQSSQAKTPKPVSAMRSELMCIYIIPSSMLNPYLWKAGAQSFWSNRNANMKNAGANPNLAQENQAIKRQKLEGGKSRQVKK